MKVHYIGTKGSRYETCTPCGLEFGSKSLFKSRSTEVTCKKCISFGRLNMGIVKPEHKEPEHKGRYVVINPAGDEVLAEFDDMSKADGIIKEFLGEELNQEGTLKIAEYVYEVGIRFDKIHQLEEN